MGLYKCDELLPFCQRLLWLSNVKEALGYIPTEFGLTYEEIKGLVLLGEESGKKLQKEQYDMNKKTASGSGAGVGGMPPGIEIAKAPGVYKTKLDIPDMPRDVGNLGKK